MEKIKRMFIMNSKTFEPQMFTEDLAKFNFENERFSKGKKLELENLKIRDNYRKEFMGNMAHELKTPLFMVQGYILTLLDGAHKDKNIRKKYLKRAGKGMQRLIYIVKDLEMINNLETGDLHLDFQKFDIVEVVQEVFELLELKAAKKNISFSFITKYEPVWVFGDIERIQQVISNLLVNSIKYGNHGGVTNVTIEDFENGKIVMRIIDNGEGIKPEFLPRLFERFYRIDKSGSRKEGGSGLGLSIVKHILEAHQEKITVKSVFGIGSEFSFSLKKFEGEMKNGMGKMRKT